MNILQLASYIAPVSKKPGSKLACRHQGEQVDKGLYTTWRMILPKILHDIMVRHFTSIPKMCALPIKAVYWCSVDWLSNLWGLISAVCQPVAPIDTDNGWSLHVVLANDCYYCSLQQLLHLSLISKTSCVAVRVYYFVWNTLQICVWVLCESHSYRTHWLNLSLHWFSLFKGNSVSLH